MTLYGLYLVATVASASWVFYDGRERVRDSPVIDALLVLVLWPIAFPWYVATRKRPEYLRCRMCRRKLKPYGAALCQRCGAMQPWGEQNANATQAGT